MKMSRVIVKPIARPAIERADEDQRERPHEFREFPLERARFTLETVETRPNGSFEGCWRGPFQPTYLMSTAERKAAMSAEILKRKLRNFPVASLTERIATS